jgi:hypothetical protein
VLGNRLVGLELLKIKEGAGLRLEMEACLNLWWVDRYRMYACSISTRGGGDARARTRRGTDMRDKDGRFYLAS